ncbi:MAG TPA: putative Ig domain-containing protein [Candidatus Limnocylindria bacterium]|nr:putative Ig domain-containing protein [Candidatus Limnocylindria bacterium]
MRTIRLSISLLLSLLLCGQVPAQAPAPPQPQAGRVRPDPKRAQKAAEQGDKAEAAGRFDEALAAYEEAARYAPKDADVIERGVALRSKLVRTHVEAAERDALARHLEQATEELGAALQVDPGNTIVAERLAQLKTMEDEPRAGPTAISGLPRLRPQAGKHDLNLRGDTKTVYEQFADLFGIKVTFDPDINARSVRLHVDNVDFYTGMVLLGTQSGTFWRPLNHTMMFVAPDTPEKRRLYAVVAEQTFPLSAAVGPEDVTEILRVLRDIIGATRIDLDTRSRTITVRDTPERLALAGELIQQLERARGEVMLEIELLEVDRNKARILGITPPASEQLIGLNSADLNKLKSSTTLTNLLTNIQQVFAGKGFSGIPAVIPIGGGLSTFLLTLPGGAANFSDSLSLVQSGRQVLLRAQDGKPASFFVGDRFPITLSLLSGSLGAGGALTGVPGSTIFPETNFTVGKNPVALVAGNFNAGTLPELAVANRKDNTITVLRNQDGGNFVAEVNSPFSLPVTAIGPTALAEGILRNTSSSGTNAGQTPDLVVANAKSNNVTVLLSSLDSSGNLLLKEATGSPYTVGNSPSSIVLADFSGDGNLDFAVANEGDSTISLFKGDGTGGFTEFPGSPLALGGTLAIDSTALPGATLQTPYSASLRAAGGSGARTWSVIAGTLPSGLSLNSATGTISGTPTAAGNSNFTVSVADSGTPTKSAMTTLSISVAAVAPLLAVANSLPNGNIGGPYDAVLTATGGKAPDTWTVAAGALPTGLTLVSTTGTITGTPNTAGSFTFTMQVTDSSAPALTAQQQFTLTPFTGPERGPVALVTSNFQNRTLANANNAPAVDLAVVNEASNNVTVLLDSVDTNGNVTFTEATNSPVAVGTAPVAIATGDLNADGVPDLAVVNQGDNTVSVLLGSSNLDGTFTEATGSPLPTATTPAGIVIANFANGAVPDIAVTNKGSSTLGVYIGQGKGTFASRIELNTPVGPSALIAATLTTSGLPDAALVSQDPAVAQGVVTVIQDSSNFANSITGGAAQTPYPASEYVDLGVKIKATPTLHPNNEVTLLLEFEIRSLAGSSVNGIPVISNRTLTQTVRVREDEPTLIGGITDAEETHSITGLPGFAEIPGVGYAFGGRKNSLQDTELLILVTPRKLRRADHLTRAIFAGRGDTGGRGTPAPGTLQSPGAQPPQP